MTHTVQWNWTDGQVSTLRKLWRTRTRIDDIAAAIGCNHEQVRHKRKMLGLPPRHSGSKHGVRAETSPNYWKRDGSADRAFARAMAGRAFASLTVSPDPRRMPRLATNPGTGASSMEINA